MASPRSTIMMDLPMAALAPSIKGIDPNAAVSMSRRIARMVEVSGDALYAIAMEHAESIDFHVIVDGNGLRFARKRLGWSHLQMALALRMDGPDEKLKSRIHEMEIGTRDVSGPMSVAIEALLSGFRPAGFASFDTHQTAPLDPE